MNHDELRKLIRECLSETLGITDDDPMDAPRDSLVKTFDAFTNAYVSAAMATSTDNSTPSGGRPLDDNYTYKDFHIDTLKRMKKDCEDFQQKFSKYVEQLGVDDNEAGTMFWLSRNGHGTGFWDVKDWRDENKEAWGDLLHKAAKSYGQYDLYIANEGQFDGMIFGYPS